MLISQFTSLLSGNDITIGNDTMKYIMDLNNKVALKIKEIREKKNFSQLKFSKLVNMSNSAYSRIENGEVQITLNTLDKIAEKLSVPLLELLDFKSTQINHFNNNAFVQSGENTLNISLTPDEFLSGYQQIKGKKN